MKKVFIIVAVAVIGALSTDAKVITGRDVDKVLGQLTVEQKARLLVGVAGNSDSLSHVTDGAAGWTYPIVELGVPSINLADGPIGVRINPVVSDKVRTVYDEQGLPRMVCDYTKADFEGKDTYYCTAMPSNAALAATWDHEAARRYGAVMGDEAKAYGIDVVLMPGINTVRYPLCGRNFEYLSEDPVLTGELARELVDGIQAKGIGSSLKHFVANNQQTGKKFSDSRMSQRALREIYLRAFENVIKNARPWTVMSSYNLIGGQYTQTNPELMIDLLRDEWGYDGLVVTDWAVYRPTDALVRARTGLIMPGSEKLVQEIIDGVDSGAIPMEALDAAARDVLTLVAKSITAKGWTPAKPDLKANAALSREIAGEGMVLLKNDNSALPLAKDKKIALFGASAYKSIAGGTGSSNVNKEYIIDIDEGLENVGYKLHEGLAGNYRKYVEAQNFFTEKVVGVPFWQEVSYMRTVVPEPDLTTAKPMIRRMAGECDAAVIVIGRLSSEEYDRQIKDDYNLTEQERNLIDVVSSRFREAGKPVIAVLNVGSSMEVDSWRDKVDALLVAWMPGQEAGNAVADVISGDVNPSGRLPVTFAVNCEDHPSSANYPYIGQTEGRNFDYTNYEEDIWVGYRYFDKARRRVAYPFGYGMSYTTFDYSQPVIKKKKDRWEVTVDVTNTGNRPGREVVQLYVSAPGKDMIKPVAELKAFGKTAMLAPGETATMTLTFTPRDLASFDETGSQWALEAGDYTATLRRHGQGDDKTVAFSVGRPQTWKVKDILAPVVPVKTITPAPNPVDDMVFHDASEFPVIGRAYPDVPDRYQRIPSTMRKEFREVLYEHGRNSTGLALRFRTDATGIAVRWENTFEYPELTHLSPIAARGCDLYAMTDEGKWRFVGVARPMNSGENTWYVVANLPGEECEYMLHLPLRDGLEKIEIGVPREASVKQPALDSPRQALKPVVIYGSSIQHGEAASRPGMAASNILRRRLDRDVINLGFSAQAHLDYEVARFMAGIDAAAYVLDFMPNATPAEIEEKVMPFVEIIRKARPDLPLVFIEVPEFAHAYKEFDQNYVKYIAVKNSAIKQKFKELKDAGDDNIHYIDSVQLLQADGDGTTDGYHFSDTSMTRYADLLQPLLERIIKD